MTFRITKITEERQTTIRMDGRLDSVALPHLEQECQAAERPLVLDVSNVVSADNASVGKIRELISAGAEIRGTSRYLEMLLNDERARQSGEELLREDLQQCPRTSN